MLRVLVSWCLVLGRLCLCLCLFLVFHFVGVGVGVGVGVDLVVCFWFLLVFACFLISF